MQTAKDLIELCKDKHVTVSSCESLTAGLLPVRLLLYRELVLY